MPTMTVMPVYKCHKEVWALKIKAIELANPEPCEFIYGEGRGAQCGYPPDKPMHVGSTDPVIPVAGRHQYQPKTKLENGEEWVGAIITPEEEGYASFPVTPEYIRKHNPQVGGYYVVYKDGYKSFSPADAFEEGYTRI